jgi:ABC-2 type transport system permease protein
VSALAERHELREIRGPSAFGGAGELTRFAALTWSLALMEFKVRYFGSALGYLWQLVRPLMLFGVLYTVFTQFVKFNAGVEYFPAVLLSSIVLYTFFSDATSGAVTSVLDRENLVRKIQFPRVVVPLATVLNAFFNLITNLGAVAVFIVATGVRPNWTWLGFPFLLLLLVILATGTSMLLSALYVRFRDVRPIWEVVLQLLFYGSPILYAIEIVPSETARHALMCNPIAAILQQSRHWLIDPSAPSAPQAIGSWWLMLIPIGISAVLCVLGLWYFDREAPRIAEDV